MKLYTEDEIKRTFGFGMSDIMWNGYMNAIKPIELPTDEEIGKEMDKLPYEKHLDDGLYNDGVLDGFELGTQWMREQIDKQINQQA